MRIIDHSLSIRLLKIILFLIIPVGLVAQESEAEGQILEHGAMIRQAFADGDIAKIYSLHHPEVLKALGYKDLKTGRDEVIDGIRETLANFNLEFIKNDVESILIEGDMAIEQTQFSIRGTPKDGGDSWVFNGRTMVTYVRYPDSPSGWATIREMIQLATN